MNPSNRARELRDRLERFGDPRRTWKWHTGEIDYVAALDVTLADAPLLLAEAQRWLEPYDWPDDEEDVTGYAPVHAWRAAAQLRATEAIDVLIDMMGQMDERGDDWHLEEFPYAFKLIGPASLPPLLEVLADDERGDYVRTCAAHSLTEVAQRYSECRDTVVGMLAGLLKRPERQPDALNGFLIGYLMDLDAASEAVEDIERAFAADRVDLMVAGNWNSVRAEVGIEGKGLVPAALASASPHAKFMSRTTPSKHDGGGSVQKGGKRYKCRTRRSR